MAIGLTEELLPIVRPADALDGQPLYASAILLEAGAIGLFVS